MSDNSEAINPRIVEQHGDETSIRLRATGWDKWVDGLIRLMKLFGWAFVEVFLASQILAAMGWRTPAVFDEMIDSHLPEWVSLLILVFLAVWTAVGVSAISSLLREIFGSDLIVLTSGEIRVRRLVGPFGRERVFKPGSIDWVAIKGQTRLLFISVLSKEIVIASLGTWPERRFVAETLEKRYGLKTPSEKAQGVAPAGWTSDRSADGFVSLRNSSHDRSLIGCTGVIAAVCWLIAIANIFVHFLADPLKLTIGEVLTFTVAVMSTVFVVWAARASQFIRVRRNEVVIETSFGPWKRQRKVCDATLRVSFQTTSKSMDDVFTLEAVNQDKSTKLCVRIDDATEVVALARTLAQETGWNLEIAKQALQA